MNILKQYRKLLGINQADLAFDLETSQSDISKIENDWKDISVFQAGLFIDLAKIQGIEISLDNIYSLSYKLEKVR